MPRDPTFIVDKVTKAGSGHLGSNLGDVELTIALHRVLDSPRDVILWDTGHQTYVHKIAHRPKGQFDTLRQAGGMSGYPSRRRIRPRLDREQPRVDRPGYAHGLATAFDAPAGRVSNAEWSP